MNFQIEGEQRAGQWHTPAKRRKHEIVLSVNASKLLAGERVIGRVGHTPLAHFHLQVICDELLTLPDQGDCALRVGMLRLSGLYSAGVIRTQQLSG